MVVKKKKIKKNKKFVEKAKKPSRFGLPEEIRRSIFGVLMFLIAIIIVLAFFDLAGLFGEVFMSVFSFLIGKTVFVFPLLFVLAGLVFLGGKKESRFKKNGWLITLAIFVLILGITGILGVLSSNSSLTSNRGYGGWLGYLISWPFLKALGFWAAQIIFFGVIAVGGVILGYLFRDSWQRVKISKEEEEEEKEPSFIKKIFAPKFTVKEIEPTSPLVIHDGRVDRTEPSFLPQPGQQALKTKPLELFSLNEAGYQYPPLDLLESDRGVPSSGDIKINSAIIKRTLQNFDIPVEMSEVNIGPTVTQYTLKPAEGVKLSKITALNNDLSLALAAHPLRIEAPIPGRPLVGIELPNKTKTLVRLRNLLEHPNFQNSVLPLTFVLGRDVAGNPAFADLTRMPHLLVAGSTGTGKTICLNSIIISLLYRNSPQILRFILIDPKRVEFLVYNQIPHLLTPVIFDAQKTINVLKWLIGEMERRFDFLATNGSKDIGSYNTRLAQENSKQGEGVLKPSPLPYIVLIVDELADLMASRGREVEAAIVRLAQMARAVGIHLVLATQRPSVEVITGLIKANITARITFQVASQVDSRTVLDMAGAEKLLGFGDMLFLSAEVSKPRRVQGAYVSEKEIKKAVNFIVKAKTKIQEPELEGVEGVEEPAKDELTQSAAKTMEEEEGSNFFAGEDPLYEEAKRVVIESRKASASLLQRRLRLGYARAARLIDMLEERGVVGPGEGAKPREVYGAGEEEKDKEESDDGYVKM